MGLRYAAMSTSKSYCLILFRNYHSAEESNFATVATLETVVSPRGTPTDRLDRYVLCNGVHGFVSS